jgi:AcrR family transcriptional regulator
MSTRAAADVGVTKGALHHHLSCEDGLVEAVCKEAIRRHADRVIEALGLTVNAELEGLPIQQLEPPAQQRRWVAKLRSLLEDLS